MPDRPSARRRDLQRRMKEAEARICRNGKEFERAIAEWRRAATEDGLLAFIGQIIECYSRLVQNTPEDTGRARAGWHIEARMNEWKPAPGVYRDRIARLVAEQTAKLPALSASDVIYIMNNVEYILPLEAGYSRRGAGFFALFIAELKAQLEAAAARSRRGNA